MAGRRAETVPTVAIRNVKVVKDRLADGWLNHNTTQLVEAFAGKLNTAGATVTVQQLADAVAEGVMATNHPVLAADACVEYAHGIAALLITTHDVGNTLADVIAAAGQHAVRYAAVKDALSNFPGGKDTRLTLASEAAYRAGMTSHRSNSWHPEITGFVEPFISLVELPGLTAETLTFRVRSFLRSEVFAQPAARLSTKRHNRGSDQIDRFCLNTNVLSFVFAEDQQSGVQPLLFAIGTERQSELELDSSVGAANHALVRAAEKALGREVGRRESVTGRSTTTRQGHT